MMPWLLLAWCVAASLSCAGRAPGPATQKGGFVRLAAPPDRFAPPRRKLLLAVGVDRYRADGGWRDLRFPGVDAAAMAELLGSEGGFETVALLRDQVTRAELLAAMDQLAARIRDPSDVVLVYLSGHGTLARNARGELARYLVSSDTRMADVPGSAVAVSELERRFGALGSARKVLVLATCHSGEGKSALPARLLQELATYKSAFFPPPMAGVSRAALILGAAGWGEPAREDPELGHDIYTYYLLEAIRRRYDPDQDGAVTVTEAHDYARRLTYQRSGGSQRPSLVSDVQGTDPIVLAGHAGTPALPLLVAFGPQLEGFSLLVDGVAKGQLPGGIAVDPGTRRLELAAPSGEIVATQTVALATGQRLLLDPLLGDPRGPPPPRWSATLGLGYQGFLGTSARRSLMEPVLLPRLVVAREGLMSGRLRLQAELGGTLGATSGQATLREANGDAAQVPYGTQALQGGGAATWSLWRWPRLELSGGAALSLLYFERWLLVDGAPDAEHYASLAPSALLQGRLQAAERVFFQATLRASYLPVRVDGAWRHETVGDAELGAGVSF